MGRSTAEIFNDHLARAARGDVEGDIAHDGKDCMITGERARWKAALDFTSFHPGYVDFKEDRERRLVTSST